MSTTVLGSLLALLAIFVVARLVMRRRLLVKYAALWLTVTVALVILALAPGVLDFLSRSLGFEVRSNMLFFTGFGLLLFVTLQMSVELTTVEAQVQRLAEELAIAQSTGGVDEPTDQPNGRTGTAA